MHESCIAFENLVLVREYVTRTLMFEEYGADTA